VAYYCKCERADSRFERLWSYGQSSGWRQPITRYHNIATRFLFIYAIVAIRPISPLAIAKVVSTERSCNYCITIMICIFLDLFYDLDVSPPCALSFSRSPARSSNAKKARSLSRFSTPEPSTSYVKVSVRTFVAPNFVPVVYRDLNDFLYIVLLICLNKFLYVVAHSHDIPNL